MAFDPKKFTVQKARPLPIILLLDRSSSMAGAKIASLNEAVRRMIGTLVKEESQDREFLLSMISFGGTASLDRPPTPASAFEFHDLSPNGDTPLGAALDLAKALVEDQVRIPSRAFRPLIVLVSDGMPTDSWNGKLENFVKSGRSSKCDRMALAIGSEAINGRGRATLEAFVDGTERQIFEAHEAAEIVGFFRMVTMSTVARLQSKNPDEVPKIPTPGNGRVEPPEPPASDEDAYW